jgi:hypothetical protein
VRGGLALDGLLGLGGGVLAGVLAVDPRLERGAGDVVADLPGGDFMK